MSPPRRRVEEGRFLRVGTVSRSARTRWWGLALGLALLLYLALFGQGGWLAVHAEAVAVEDLERENAAAERLIESLQARQAAYDEPGSFELERVARERYRMQRPGEEVLHLVPSPGEDGSGPGS